MIETLFSDLVKPKEKRVKELPSLLATAGTGQYNFYMLGHATRPIQMTRGGKEGNNALLKDAANEGYINSASIVTNCLDRDIGIDLIQKLVLKSYVPQTSLCQNIYKVVRSGHRKLAGKLIELYGHGGFNDLHKEVLLHDKQNLKQFKQVSVKKKGQLGNKSVSPLHCACINPNEKYLEQLIAVEPDFNTPDEDHWRPLHYAAACTGSGPIKVLLKKGVSLFDTDKQGNTPLHIAAELGNCECLDILCTEVLKTDKSALEKKNRKGYTPIHLAAKRGHSDAVKTLLEKHGPSVGGNKGKPISFVDIQTGAARNKVTPLMLAAQEGHLQLVKWLVEKGSAKVDKRFS